MQWWLDWECLKSGGELYYGQPSDKYGNADKISVKIQHGSTTIYGIIVGYDKENEVLKISQLNSSSDISAGDKVTTGGLGNFNVADIPVGEVVATTHSADYLTREVTVKLSADTHNVSVIELVGNS